MRILPSGDRALLLDCADLTEARGWHDALAGTAEVVLGARTVLLRGDPAELRRLVGGTSPVEEPRLASGETVTIEVDYDGPDLTDVAELVGLSPAEVVAAHTGSPWTVAFAGFAPGFGYLVGGDDRLRVPRRAAPRPRVPTGAVGLAGAYSGIYPRPSPGGWQLIGRTQATLWDLARDVPALLRPGTVVRFEAA